MPLSLNVPECLLSELYQCKENAARITHSKECQESQVQELRDLKKTRNYAHSIALTPTSQKQAEQPVQ